MEITWTWWVAFLFLMNQAFWMTQERRYPGSLRESQRRSANEMGEQARELDKELKKDIAQIKRDLKRAQRSGGFGKRLNLKVGLLFFKGLHKLQRWASKPALKIEEKYG